MRFFASTPKAMEHCLTQELTTFGAENIKQTVAGVAFQGSLKTAYFACLWSRFANRILLVLDEFAVNSQDELYACVRKSNWSQHLNPDGSFAVSFNAKNSNAIKNSHFGALKVKDAIVDQIRERHHQRPSIDTEYPDIRVNVFLNGNQAVLSLDLSGESLHKRGYRDNSVPAPLKENLAAALLQRSRWPEVASQGGALLDPMCGSGTLLLEGALMAADYAPGLLRKYYGFLGWRQHQPDLWHALKQEAEQRKQSGITKLPMIIGFDRHRRAVNAAMQHIENAGLQGKIHIERRDIADAMPAESWEPGLIICNPPYGERLGDEEEVIALYQQYGLQLKQHFKNWRAAIIISNAEYGFRLGIRSEKPVTFFNGAMECKLLRMQVAESAFFVPKATDRTQKIQQLNEIQAKTQATEGALMFRNRLLKNLKKQTKWAKRHNIQCYRLYDADLPEYAIAVDLYQSDDLHVNVQEYQAPKSIDEDKADQRLSQALLQLSDVLQISNTQLHLKVRRKQKSLQQYEKQDNRNDFYKVMENGCRFYVNFENYLDTGLFLDHRLIRQQIQQESKDKDFLNLFAYTCSASVHAAYGGARSTTSVDMSATYLDWGKKNFALNHLQGQNNFIQADILQWLTIEVEKAKKYYDLIFLDPPTFSNSKRMEQVFDIQSYHPELIENCMKILKPGGTLYFSTNFRRFKIDSAELAKFKLENISQKTIDDDFARNPKIHYCWKITA